MCDTKFRRESNTSVAFKSAQFIHSPMDDGRMGIGFRLYAGENIHEFIFVYNNDGITGVISSTNPALLEEICNEKRRMI